MRTRQDSVIGRTSTNESINFTYQPLPSQRSIRLIQFLPGAQPQCTLFTVEIEKAPPYIALSYTWGCKDRLRSIQVNGSRVPITSNLAEAIDAVLSFAKERRLMFWADSICINQENLVERGSQVRLMNTIYRSAAVVAIWLGPSADESDLVFDKLRSWKLYFDTLKDQHNGSEELAITSLPSDDLIFFGPHAQSVLHGLRMMCRRPWWSRAWVR
jgi:hypothetical protein